MWEFFRGWKRKLGVVTLMLALVFLGAWGASLNKIWRFSFRSNELDYHLIASLRGDIVCQQVVPVDSAQWAVASNKWATQIFQELSESVAEQSISDRLSNDDKFQWKYRSYGFGFGHREFIGSLSPVRVTIWTISYWWLITPLTLLSSYLLLSKSKPISRPRINEISQG